MTWLLDCCLLASRSIWVTIFSAHLKTKAHCSPSFARIVSPDPAWLFLRWTGQFQLVLLDGRVVKVQQAARLLPGLLDRRERSADTQPWAAAARVDPLPIWRTFRSSWRGWRSRRPGTLLWISRPDLAVWRRHGRGGGGGRGREHPLVTRASLYLDDGRNSFSWFRAASTDRWRRARPPAPAPTEPAALYHRNNLISGFLFQEVTNLGAGYLWFVQQVYILEVGQTGERKVPCQWAFTRGRALRGHGRHSWKEVIKLVMYHSDLTTARK